MLHDDLIRLVTEKCQKNVESIGMETRLDELGIDSMRAIVLLYELEELYDIEIPNEVFDSIETVGDVAMQIEKLTGETNKVCHDV